MIDRLIRCGKGKEQQISPLPRFAICVCLADFNQYDQSLRFARSFGCEVPLRLAAHLLGLDLGRDNGVVDDMWSVDSVHGWHPVWVSD